MNDKPDAGHVNRGWKAGLRLLSRLPQPALSRFSGRLADLAIPRALRGPVLGTFARIAGIDVREAEKPLAAYRTLDAFFVRRLRAGARAWPADPAAVASPVDGLVGECGPIEDGRLLQAKGRSYTAGDLLGSDEDAGRFRHGAFITLYLSPRHYHRIHAPVAGEIPRLRRIPGALLPVNRHAVATIDRLFPRNERAVCFLHGPAGCVAVVAVGAFNVGRITAAFLTGHDGRHEPLTNLRSREPRVLTLDPPVRVDRGDEIMAFHLGSTVVLLFEAGRVDVERSMRGGHEVRLGSTIAVVRTRKQDAANASEPVR